MKFSTTKQNGSIRIYTRKHLEGLGDPQPLPSYSQDFYHYGYLGENICIFEEPGDTGVVHFFAKNFQGHVGHFVYLSSGPAKPQTIGLPLPQKKFRNPFYAHLGLFLYVAPPKEISIYRHDEAFIKDVTEYLIDYYDIMQNVLHDEYDAGNQEGDHQPNFSLIKYLVKEPGHALAPYALPYTIKLPLNNRKITITDRILRIEPLE